MPHSYEWLNRIKAVEREYVAMHQAAEHFRQAARDDPTILGGDLRQAEIEMACRNLEGTYVMRLFAEFETGARQCWVAKWGTEPGTFDLLEGLAARCSIRDTDRQNAHRVRDYRNRLVHEREDETEAVSVREVRAFLCRFFSHLPARW